MPDMLVKLYDLEQDWRFVAAQAEKGIVIRKPIAPEFDKVKEWVRAEFSAGWASEVAAALYNHPVSCFIAEKDGKILGFAAYDATVLGFFGPTGVSVDARGQGTGKALLLACMLDMKLKGYGYAVIGGAGPTGFYAKAVHAVEIPDSVPGMYKGMLD